MGALFHFCNHETLCVVSHSQLHYFAYTCAFLDSSEENCWDVRCQLRVHNFFPFWKVAIVIFVVSRGGWHIKEKGTISWIYLCRAVFKEGGAPPPDFWNNRNKCVINKATIKVWDSYSWSLSWGSIKGVFLVLKLRVSISSKVDHDSLVSSKMEKPW